ncbi:MAG: hypothetical protein AUK26_06575 [Syntrophaceae bacterium CG2_30_58_14]|nr:MAG: hypothetical protein AUK26_06575 [Syntrophaceae bacterium CG2_30_58_14]
MIPIQSARVFRLIPSSWSELSDAVLLVLLIADPSGQAGIFFSHRFSFHGQVYFMGVVDQPVEDGVGRGIVSFI